ncbi:DUF2125 domain-containing protein [Rhodobacter sp. SGA-6-6]|uniref:DUF2125 domain-containing protein n=1 Tax=Rhodobacter sp. SGA-6-6 TaxID=2710882 RepID=UPI0013EDE7FB|nr:DUF2125 domain-containing protein [Rhodobacter sp. SGA-6-6]NGM44007.1 DUF2125 domain-containing protein [Rhodobacter sp. SGA-6-6]
MFQFRTLAAVPALVFLMGGTAHAALTADQVWQSWKDAGAMAGLTVTAATESNAGGVLTLNGVSIAPEGAANPFTISDMTLTENSDGTVTIAPGAAIGIAASEGANAAKVDLVHDGLVITASEDAGALVYDFEAAKLDVTYDIASEGYSFDDSAPAPVVKNGGKVGFEALEGSYSDTPGDNRMFGLDLTAAKFLFDSTTDDPGMGMKTSSVSETADFTAGFDVTLPSTTPLAELQGPAGFRKALEEGFAIALTFGQGAGTGSAKQESEFFPYEMTMASAGGEGSASFDKDKFTMVSQSGNVQLNITSTAFPAPMEMTLAEAAMDLNLPVIATEAQDAWIKMKLDQLALSEGVWGMFDPGAALKRDPLDLNIDVSGRTTLDLLAMAEAEETGATPPVPAPEKLDITDITLKVAGAALNATGAFTFDNSMGMPMPVGTAKVNVDGANALIDGLIKTGLVQEQDAMGVRMMMGMFMKPSGNGDDSLTSDIEVKEGMQILVNGQPLPM